MKFSNRKEKLLMLQAAINGNSSGLRHYQRQLEPFFIVVSSNGTPKPTDLVDVRIGNVHGQKCTSYADFLKSPVAYGSFCVTVDSYEPN
ncbi:hypothetical protein GCM10028805_48980 [Spirosoma harenae]